MNAPDSKTKLDIVYDKNPLFTFVKSVSTNGIKYYNPDNDHELPGRYVMLQSTSPLKFREISPYRKWPRPETWTKFHVKKGVATESLECPDSHPYAFRGGAQCCAGHRERNDSTAPDSDWPSEYFVIRNRFT